MVALPILILCSGSLILVLVRKQHARMQWVLALVFSMAAWLSLMVSRNSLGQFPPVPMQEEAAAIILPGLSLTDVESWAIPWNLIALLVAVILTVPARFQVPTWDRWAILLAFFAGLSATLLSNNIMTGLLLWTVVEGIILIVSAQWASMDGSSISSRFAWRLIVISFLMVSGALITGAMGNAQSGPLRFAAEISFAGSILLLIALPTTAIPASKQETLDSDFSWLFQAAPAIIGLSFLGRIFSNLAAKSLNWILVLGILGMCYGVLRWISSREQGTPMSYLALGITSISMVFGTSLGGGGAATGILSSAAGVVTILGMLGLLRNYSRMYQVLLVLVVFIVCGLPGIPGQGWLEMGIEAQRPWSRLSIGGLGIIAISGLLWLHWKRDRQHWFTEESLAKLAYWSGLGLLVIAALAAWVLEKPYSSVRNLIILLALSASSIGFAYLLHKIRANSSGMMIIHRLTQVISNPQRALHPFRWIGNAMQWSARVFEGEAGMLWVLVVLQAVLLALLRDGL